GVIAECADRIAVLYAGRLVEIGGTRQVLDRPLHPYTRGLMASIPDIGQLVEELPQIPGTMPRLDAMPAGCAFHARCADAVAICRNERPALEPRDSGLAACWCAGGRPLMVT